MNDTTEVARQVAREVATEFAALTNDRIEQYQIQTNSILQQLGSSMTKLADSQHQANLQLVRYEEQQMNSSERMERIEQTQKEQGTSQRQFNKELLDKMTKLEKSQETKHQTLRDEVRDNSIVRKALLWLAAALIIAMLGGGMLFSSLTGKVPQTPVSTTP